MPRHPITLQRVVYRLEGMEAVPVQRNVEYRRNEEGALAMDEGSAVADAARTYGFVNACAGNSMDDLPLDVPLFIARSGQDELPGLNDALDHFVSAAVGRNLPMTFVNHPTAPHCFELNDDSELSRSIIGQMLAFMQFHLT